MGSCVYNYMESDWMSILGANIFFVCVFQYPCELTKKKRQNWQFRRYCVGVNIE